VRFLLVPYLLFIGVLAVLAQMILPAQSRFLSDIGFDSALLPLVVIYASLELGDELALVVAGLLGAFLDLMCSHRFGVSVLVLMSISALIVTQARRPEAHQWFYQLLFVLVGTFAFMLISYFFLQVEMWRWTWPLAAWSKITFACLLNLLISPLFFYLVGWPPRLCGWKPNYERPERYHA